MPDFTPFLVSGLATAATYVLSGVGIVVLLLRLGILGSAQRTGMTTMVPWQQSFGTQPPPAMPSAPASAQRLQELDGLLRSGAISDTEYSAKRQQILSTM